MARIHTAGDGIFNGPAQAGGQPGIQTVREGLMKLTFVLAAAALAFAAGPAVPEKAANSNGMF